MNELALECANQVVDPAMHEKILLRAAELVAMGWTRGTAARSSCSAAAGPGQTWSFQKRTGLAP